MSQDQQSASAWVPPGAADISLDRKVLKSLMRRSDGIPLLRLAVCVSLLCALGALYAASFGTWWFIPTLIMFGGATSLCVYSLSHECAHGTVFRSRWLNETVFWLASLVYGQEVLYRRYSHASHHTYTMYVGKDGQLPFPQPAHLASYLLWYTGAMYYIHFMKILVLHSLGRFNERTLAFTPVEELPRIVRNSRAFLAIYALAIVLSVYFESTVLVWFWLLPKLAGDPIAALYAGSQHFEKMENTHDLRESTRSLRPNPLIDLFYWNMSYHIEHHLYPTVPFHALPKLNALIRQQLPPPPGMMAATKEIITGWWKRASATPAATMLENK